MSQAQLKTAFYDGMVGVSAFATAVGSRIYEGEAPQNADLPLVIYSVIDDAPREAFGGSHVDALVQVDLYYSKKASTSATATTTNDLLYAGLHRTLLTMAGHSGVTAFCVDRGQLTYEEDATRITSQWQIAGTLTP